MRPLEESELRLVFQKLQKFLGSNLQSLVEREDATYVLRLHRKRVYYMREDLMRKATNIARKHLVHLGTCIGKFTHHNRFHVTISALDVLAAFARNKVWVKPSAEMSFLYGNHVLKSGLARITEDTPSNSGVVVYNMSDVPIGLGTCVKSTDECRKVNPGTVVTVNQGDVGEYLRAEESVAGTTGFAMHKD